jgi:hypothetical protein
MLKDKTGFIAKIDVPAQVEVAKIGVGDVASRTGRITIADIHQNDLVCIEGDPGDKVIHQDQPAHRVQGD